MSPSTFNYIIMTLYGINAVWWAMNKNWPQTMYWLAALQITAAVTWGLGK